MSDDAITPKQYIILLGFIVFGQLVLASTYGACVSVGAYYVSHILRLVSEDMLLFFALSCGFVAVLFYLFAMLSDYTNLKWISCVILAILALEMLYVLIVTDFAYATVATVRPVHLIGGSALLPLLWGYMIRR